MPSFLDPQGRYQFASSGGDRGFGAFFVKSSLMLLSTFFSLYGVRAIGKSLVQETSISLNASLNASIATANSSGLTIRGRSSGLKVRAFLASGKNENQ